MSTLVKRIQARARRLRYAIRGTATGELLRDYGANIGENVFFGNGTYVDEGFAWLVTIEDQVTLAPGVKVLAHDAGMWQSTGHTLVAEVRIETGAYVGAGAIIMPGVTVGREAVVGAGSVVTHDVAPRTVVAGVPARVVRTVAELAASHQAAQATARAGGGFGWSRSERASHAGQAAIRAQIRTAGRAYVE